MLQNIKLLSQEKRNGKIELMRVISMLQILILHYLLLGGVLDVLKNSHGLRYYVAWLLEAFSYVAVNVFVIISGYFLSQSKIFKPGKLLSIILQCWIYSIGIYMIGCACGVVHFSLPTLITAYLLPLISGKWWFVACYLVLYGLSPFLNILHTNLSQKLHLGLNIMLGTVFSVVPSTIFWTGNTIGVNGGYSLIWFIFLYLLAAYIQKYSHEWNKGIPWFIIYIIACLMTWGLKVSQELVIGKVYWKTYSYISITVLVASVAMFMSFMNSVQACKETKIDALWRLLGKGTLGVFLIHTHFIPYKEFLWNKWCKADLFWLSHHVGYCLIHLLIWVLGIFIICDIIDVIRGRLFYPLEKYLAKINFYNDLFTNKI
ncbi:MAG: acyltransferase [Treponema sp.]|nr:acyltransferase [Treponema sp.]